MRQHKTDFYESDLVIIFQSKTARETGVTHSCHLLFSTLVQTLFLFAASSSLTDWTRNIDALERLLKTNSLSLSRSQRHGQTISIDIYLEKPYRGKQYSLTEMAERNISFSILGKTIVYKNSQCFNI